MHVMEVLESKEDSTPKLIKYFTGKDPDTIPIGEYGVYSDLVKTLVASKPSEKIHDVIEVKDRKFKSITDVTKFSTNQGTALETYYSKGAHKHLNGILSLCFYPVDTGIWDSDNQAEIAKDFLKVKIGSVYGTVFFYSKVYERLNPILQLYFLQAQEEINEILTEMMEDEGFQREYGINSGQSTDGMTS
jgi:hypothetical protein